MGMFDGDALLCWSSSEVHVQFRGWYHFPHHFPSFSIIFHHFPPFSTSFSIIFHHFPSFSIIFHHFPHHSPNGIVSGTSSQICRSCPTRLHGEAAAVQGRSRKEPTFGEIRCFLCVFDEKKWTVFWSPAVELGVSDSNIWMIYATLTLLWECPGSDCSSPKIKPSGTLHHLANLQYTKMSSLVMNES